MRRTGSYPAGYWLAAGAMGAIGALAAALYAWSLAPVFSADAVVRPARGDVRVLAGRDKSAEPIDASVLTSRTVLGRVVHDNGLDIDAAPRKVPALGALWARVISPGANGLHAPPPLAVLARFGWGGEAIAVGRLDVPEDWLNRRLSLVAAEPGHYRLETADGHVLLIGNVGETVRARDIVLRVDRLTARPGTVFALVRRDEASAVERLARTLSIVPRGDGNGWQIEWRDTDRHRVATVVNDIANTYVERQAAYRRDEAARALAFVQGELPRVRGELEQAEAALSRYRSRSGSLQPTQDAQSYLSGSIDYQRQISALRLERARLLRYFMPESQEVRAIEAQIEQLNGDRRRLDSRLQGLSEAERESVALTRDVRVAEDAYMTLRNRAQALMLARADSDGDVRLLDAAVVPAVADGPPRGAMAGAGGATGALLGIGLWWLLKRSRREVADAATLEGRLALPVLGEIVYSPEQARLERDAPAGAMLCTDVIPHLLPAPDTICAIDEWCGLSLEAPAPEPVRHAGALGTWVRHDAFNHRPVPVPVVPSRSTVLHDRCLLARRAPQALAVETLRSLRAALHFSLTSAPNGVIAIASATAGAGKTFGAINLAVLAAEAGRRVLIVDADLRQGDVAARFGQPSAPGLAELLGGMTTLAHVVQPTAVAGLALLSAGAPPCNPSELLMLPALRDTLQACDASFDLVIVDTPPVLAVADATFVAHLAGATLLFVRADDTPADKVADAVRRLRQAGARLAGSVLNAVDDRHGEHHARHAETRDYLRRAATPQPETIA